MRYFIKLSYDGTDFHGWQRQPNVSSVQAVFEDNLGKLFSKKLLPIVGCGRTDAGVHASEYFAHFDTSELPMSEVDIKYKLNKMLPDAISIESIFLVDEKAHARFSAINRSYRYQIHTRKDPFLSRFSSFIPYAHELDISKINQFGKDLVLIKDFQSLARTNSNVTNFLCDLSRVEWKWVNDYQLSLSITSNRFLRGMVRLIVGASLNIGQHKTSKSDIISAIKNKQEIPKALSAPPEGLTLCKIEYPTDLFHG